MVYKACELDPMDEEFPDDASLTDLCDCGRHLRLKDQKRPPLKKRAPGEIETSYKSNFKPADKDARPRSSKRPPPSPRDRNPPAMSFNTNQRSDFKDLGVQKRVQLCKKEETYEPPTQPIEMKTYYQQEFAAKKPLPEIRRVQPLQDSIVRRSSPKFATVTTTKDHFKTWKAKKTLAFAELPCFTGSILYPGKDPIPQSTARQSYPGVYAPKTEPMKIAEGNLKLEGDIFLSTTNADAYKPFSSGHRAERVVQKQEFSQPKHPRGKFIGQTQAMNDFGGFSGAQPRPAKTIAPPQPTISLQFDNRQIFETEQRAIFKGHDIREHPVAQSCKKLNDEYQLPNTKIETMSSQMRDFQPIDMSSAYQNRVSQIATQAMTIPARKSDDAKFDGTTSNKESFKDWGAKPRVRVGDCHENNTYMPPSQPFAAESTTKRIYTPKHADPVENYKPVSKPFDKEGSLQFDTEYRKSFPGQRVRMCRAQAFLIKKELKRREAERRMAENVAHTAGSQRIKAN